MHAIGVLDRTGEIAPLVEDLNARLDGQLDIHHLSHSSPLPANAHFTFLVLGPREGSATVLRRVRQYLDANPGTLAVACGIAAAQADKKDLLAAGVRHISRAKPSHKQLVKLLREAMVELDAMAQAARVIDPSRPQPELADQAEVSFAQELDLAEAAPEVDMEPQPEPAPVVEAEMPRLEELVPAQAEPSPVEDVDQSVEVLVEAAMAAVDDELADGVLDIAALIPEQRGIGQLVTIASATGGCGKTFFATNLAMLAARAGKRCLLVDLDLQFGEVAIALRVSHPYSVYDGLYDANGKRLPDNALADHLPELTYHHKLGFDVLTAPRDPSLSDYVGARDASEILDVVMPLYDIVIVDTPPSLNEVVLVALDRSDVVAVMATLDVPSLKNLAIFLETLKRLAISDEHVKLVLNKCEADVGMKVSQAQDAFNNRFLAAIPNSRAVSRSINAGTVVCATEPRSPVSRKTAAAAEAMVPEIAGAGAGAPASRTHWWRRWAKKSAVPVESLV